MAILDGSGNIVVKYDYDAWGNHRVLNSAGAVITDTQHIGHKNPFRYRGYYYDTETGLYYLKSRYYDPAICRFINMDSVEYADPTYLHGLNLYAYCNNNPIMYVDPNGHALISILIGLGVATLIGSAIGAASYTAGQVVDYAVTGDFEWSWGGFAGATIGGAVAGAISSISLGSGVIGYLTTAISGGFGSVLGGMISGSVTDLKSGLIAFGIGAIANVAAKGITSLINKGVSVAARKALNNQIFDDFTLGDLTGSALKNNSNTPAYNKLLNQVAKLVLKANGQWAKSSMYSVANASISSLLSGWY